MKIRLVAACAVVLALNAISRASVIYDPVANFSTSENTESSVWSYRYRVGATFDGNYPLIPDYGPAAGTWTPANPGAWRPGPTGPEIGVNATADPITNTTTNVTWSSQSIVLRPSNGQIAVLSWLNPYANQKVGVAYRYQWKDIDVGGGDGEQIRVEWRSSDGTLGGYSWSSGGDGGYGGTQGFAYTSSVEPGERLNFIVDPKNNASHDSIQLTVTIKVLPADFDSDGDVDGADFVTWQTHFPTTSEATGDANGDGDVDGDDFTMWQSQFRTTLALAPTPIPEPSALILALLTISLLGKLGCRRMAAL